jgi:glycosyltransferase involved in cell wall biosynthesis
MGNGGRQVQFPAFACGGILITMHSLSQGGGDRVAVLLANGFARAGIRTNIALMTDRGNAEQELRALLDPNVSVASGGAPLNLPLARILERLRGIRFIRRQIDLVHPQFVLAATDNMAFVTALARKPGSSEPLFVQKLTNRLLRPTIGPFRKIYRYNLFKFIFRRLDLILTLTEAERRNVGELFPDKAALLRTVPNPYVSEDMLVDQKSHTPGPPRLVTAGRLVQQKRFDVLLRALASSSHTRARLTILGDGPLRSWLEQLVESLSLRERVDMPGFVADIAPWLRRSDLFVLSSDYEGLPAAVIEALACNVPVVATNSFLGAEELLSRAPSCAVVQPDNPEALAKAIDEFLTAGAQSTVALRRIARPYRVEASVVAHVNAMIALAGERLPSRSKQIDLSGELFGIEALRRRVGSYGT